MYFLCMQKWKCHVDTQSPNPKQIQSWNLGCCFFFSSCPGLTSKWLSKSHKFITGDITYNVLNQETSPVQFIKVTLQAVQQGSKCKLEEHPGIAKVSLNSRKMSQCFDQAETEAHWKWESPEFSSKN